MNAKRRTRKNVHPSRNQRRMTRRNGTRVKNSKGSNGFPDSEVAVLRYSEEIAVTGTLYGQYTFRGNSVFDPNETGIGHQPLYYDEYDRVYQKYKVVASTCRVTATNYNAAASAVIVLTPSSEIITITSYPVAMEQPYAKRTELLPVSTRQGSQSTVKSAMTTRKMLGLSSAQFASEDYSASTGSNPASIWYWNISAFDIVEVSVRLVVDLEYRVIFYDRQAATLSKTLKVVKTPQEIEERRKRQADLPLVMNYVVPTEKSVRRVSL